MERLINTTTPCTCGTMGRVHAPSCGCEKANEFLMLPTVQYAHSRRDFLHKALVGGLTVSALPLLSAEAQADLFMPSRNDQIKAGAQAAQQVLQKYREVNDSRAVEFRRVGTKLVNALTGDDRNWNYSFKVIDSKEVNAFALPGGSMFMFTGLQDRIHSSSELAAVTGHEMTHVRKQHWARAVASQQKREIGLGILLGVTHAGGLARTAAGLFDQFTQLKYSRSEEDQADAGGLDNMVAAGFNPNGMLDLFHTLEAASGGKSGGPAFLSDHPLTSERIKHTQQRIAQLQGSNPGNG